jgi:hypothetical protein
MMSTTVKNPEITPIPVQLSETVFTAFIFPHLSMRKRGPKCKLGLFAQPLKRVYSSMGALGMGKVGMTTGG